MSRVAEDTLAVIRGLKLVLRETIQIHENHTKHLWKNSSVRQIAINNIGQTKQCLDNLQKNPQKEFQRLIDNVKETSERGGVMTNGLKQYLSSNLIKNEPITGGAGVGDGGDGINIGAQIQENNQQSNINKEAVRATINKNLLDISSITLKELQTILSQKSSTNSGNLSNVNFSIDEIIVPPTTPNQKQPTKTISSDEKFVKHVMNNFILNQNTNDAPKIVKPITNITTADIKLPELSSVAKQRSVPSSRISRMASFGTLFAGLGFGTVAELTKGAIGLGGTKNMKEALFSPGNTERIVETLCKVRGAALKIGQILSIQDSNLVSPEMVRAFERVRQAADYMPDWQVKKCMEQELGANWRDELLLRFDERPFAAASIGQVHRAQLKGDHNNDNMEVAIKIQYPGVAKSIESDIDNLVGMLKVWDVFPAGFFIDNIVKVAKRELAWEVDYLREAEYTEKFGEMIALYPEYRSPKVIKNLSTKFVLTTELVPGIPVDKCFELSYDERSFIAESVLKLCLRELFEFRCMQTDPNWSNFLYDSVARQIVLIDFGSTRFYTNEFIENYRDVIKAAVNNDSELVLTLSRKMGFLTGYETRQMEEAHVTAVMTLGELFKYPGEFDFGKQETTKRIANLVPTMVAHRLCPPPEEIYSIHRKLSGVFLLCSRLNVKLDCRPYYEEIVNKNSNTSNKK